MTVSVETVLWLLAAAGAGLLRLGALGWPPLPDPEAAEALATLSRNLARSPFWPSGVAGLGSSASYQSLTGWVFSGFGPTDAAARVIPALFGVFIVLMPLLIRRRIGRSTALFLAAMLAISPTVTAVSRMAGGAALAVAGLGLTLAMALRGESAEHDQQRWAWMGAGVGLALASGPTAITGLIGLAVAVAWWRWGGEAGNRLDRAALGVATLAGTVTFLAAATQLGSWLGGLSVAFMAPGQWLATWVQPGNLPWASALALLPVYEPAALVLGVVGWALSVQGDKDLGKAAGIWAFTGLLLFVLRTGRTSADLVWVVVPLSYLGSVTMLHLVRALGDLSYGVTRHLMAVAFLLLGAFGYLQLAAYSAGLTAGGAPKFVELGFVLTAVGFATALFILFGMTWSWSEAWQSLGSAAAVATLLLSFSAMWGLNFSARAASGVELWRPVSTTVDIRAMRKTLSELAVKQIGEPDGVPIGLGEAPPPSLVWAVRGFLKGTTTDQEAPAIVLLPDTGQPPTLPAKYVGQKVDLEATWGWAGPFPPDAVAWWLQRKGPTTPIRWVMYVQLPETNSPAGASSSPSTP